MRRSCVITTKGPNWVSDPSEPLAQFPGPATRGNSTLAGGRHSVQIWRCADAEAVGEQVAHWLLASRLADPALPVGLATGRTMEPVYGALARQFARLPAAERQRIRRQWCSFNLDEYVGLASSDPRSFAATMAARLVTPLQLEAGSVLLPCGAAVDPAAEARRYASLLASKGGLGLQILGIGANGHVGFNEPPCGPDVVCRCVALTASTRDANAFAFGGDPARVPHQAISLGLSEILKARRILLLATGVAKAAVLRRAFEESPNADLPASWLQSHPQVTVVADGAALGS
jgi:glucosamine-6-phosphate deaminase